MSDAADTTRKLSTSAVEAAMEAGAYVASELDRGTFSVRQAQMFVGVAWDRDEAQREGLYSEIDRCYGDAEKQLLIVLDQIAEARVALGLGVAVYRRRWLRQMLDALGYQKVFGAIGDAVNLQGIAPGADRPTIGISVEKLLRSLTGLDKGGLPPAAEKET